MQLIFAEVSAPRLRRTIRGFDLQTLRFSGFRGILALAQLTILVATPYDALMQTLVGSGAGPVCDGLRSGDENISEKTGSKLGHIASSYVPRQTSSRKCLTPRRP